jgi:hypothetical protein
MIVPARFITLGLLLGFLSQDLIRVGVARTPQQAIPLSGSYWGDAEEELGMEVTVNVKTEASSPICSTAVEAR